MTIYEATHGVLGSIITAYADDDFELLVFKLNGSSTLSVNKFKSIKDAFDHLYQEVLKQDINCTSCRKKLDRQVKRATDKYEAKKEI
jgi:hypothetical protein